MIDRRNGTGLHLAIVNSSGTKGVEDARARYDAPEARWFCLADALRARQPSGDSDSLGSRLFTGSRPPPRKGAETA